MGALELLSRISAVTSLLQLFNAQTEMMCIYVWLIAHARVGITRVHAIMLYTYVRISIRVIRVPRPTLDRIDFSRFSKARFSKQLERFCSTLLLHTATMVETSRTPRFSFWNGCYRFAGTGLPLIQSSIQPVKIEKRASELSWTLTKKVLKTKSLYYAAWLLMSKPQNDSLYTVKYAFA